MLDSVPRDCRHAGDRGVPKALGRPKDKSFEILDFEILDKDARVKRQSAPGTGNDLSHAVTNWQHDLRQVFRAAGMPEGHPHQLRDTFAVTLLEKGVPLEDVSRALGHESIKTTEKYYAKWVKARQDRLDALLSATWATEPELHHDASEGVR